MYRNRVDSMFTKTLEDGSRKIEESQEFKGLKRNPPYKTKQEKIGTKNKNIKGDIRRKP